MRAKNYIRGCIAACGVFSAAADPASEWQRGVAEWDVAAKRKHGIDELMKQRESLLQAWNSIDPIKRTHSGARFMSGINGTILSELTGAGRFDEAKNLIQEHQQFCEAEKVGLIGRDKGALEDFMQSHVRLIAALGEDPLKAKKAPYELEAVSGGYRAFIQYGGAGEERVADIDGTMIPSVPDDETLGKCFMLDARGNLWTDVVVGLSYDASAGRMMDRVRSVYVDQGTTPGGVTIYERRPGRQYLDGLARNRPRADVGSDTRVQKGGDSTDSVTMVVEKSRLPMIALVGACGLLGVAVWFVRKRAVVR